MGTNFVVDFGFRKTVARKQVMMHRFGTGNTWAVHGPTKKKVRFDVIVEIVAPWWISLEGYLPQSDRCRPPQVDLVGVPPSATESRIRAQ